MLNRRVALVIGGSGALGCELANRFSEGGFDVVVHYFKNKERAEGFCLKLQQAGKRAIAIGADLQCSADTSRLIQSSHRALGRIDVLINAAGVVRDHPFSKLTDTDWDEAIDINLRAPFYSIREVVPLMRDQGGGQIVNIGSFSSKTGRIGQANYVAAKAGLIALTQTSARELARYNIRVNIVLPGFLPTPLFMSLPESVKKGLLEDPVLKRINSLEEVGAFILHLALTANVSGQIFNLDSRVAS